MFNHYIKLFCKKIVIYNHASILQRWQRDIISRKHNEGLYYLQGFVLIGEVNETQADIDMTKIWHARLGHKSLKNLNVLVKDGYLSSKEVDMLDFYEICVLRKSHKQSFSADKHTSKNVLEYIHSDLWGAPSTPESLGGCKYFINLIDDYSLKVWVYFLKSKDEAFSKFKEWKPWRIRQGRKSSVLERIMG